VSRQVLIIDDDRIVRDALAQVLQHAGYIVTCAADGVRGLATFREQRPDIIITDIIMPEKEGIETIIEIRAEAPEIPILAISGGARIGNTDFLSIARKLGATDVLAKPFEAKELLVKVAACLEQARTRRER
jgi:DNA-binding response OmpR family regulator